VARTVFVTRAKDPESVAATGESRSQRSDGDFQDIRGLLVGKALHSRQRNRRALFERQMLHRPRDLTAMRPILLCRSLPELRPLFETDMRLAPLDRRPLVQKDREENPVEPGVYRPATAPQMPLANRALQRVLHEIIRGFHIVHKA